MADPKPPKFEAVKVSPADEARARQVAVQAGWHPEPATLDEFALMFAAVRAEGRHEERAQRMGQGSPRPSCDWCETPAAGSLCRRHFDAAAHYPEPLLRVAQAARDLSEAMKDAWGEPVEYWDAPHVCVQSLRAAIDAWDAYQPTEQEKISKAGSRGDEKELLAVDDGREGKRREAQPPDSPASAATSLVGSDGLRDGQPSPSTGKGIATGNVAGDIGRDGVERHALLSSDASPASRVWRTGTRNGHTIYADDQPAAFAITKECASLLVADANRGVRAQRAER